MKLSVLISLQNMNHILQNVKQQDGFVILYFSFPFDGIIKGVIRDAPVKLCKRLLHKNM
jgi:hypothetical protein